MEQKIVVHMKDGKIYKGVTQDFGADVEAFHLLPAEGGGVPRSVAIVKMKALFYVKDYMGNREFVARRQFTEQQQDERRVVIRFHDGEEIWGFLADDVDPDQVPGFFFFPADDRDNNIKIFVVRSALESLRRVTH